MAMHTYRLSRFAFVLAVVTLLGTARWAASANLTADFRFQGTLGNSVGASFFLANLGPGSNEFVTDTVDGQGRTVLSFPEGNGVRLAPTTSLVPSDRYSVAILFRFADVDSYRRVLDFMNGDSDTGLYVYYGRLYFYDVSDEGGTIDADTYVQIVITRDGAGNVRGYVDGKLAFAFPDSDLAVIDSNNTLRFFVDDGGEESAGAVARIRLYDDALTASEVAALERLPTTTTTTTLPPTPPPSGCSTLPDCQAALDAARPDPNSAANAKSRRAAQRIARLDGRSDRQLVTAAAKTGKAHSRAYKRAGRALNKLLKLARRAALAGRLGVPLEPLEAAVAALRALLPTS